MKIKTYKETETELELPHFFKLKYPSIGDSYYAIFSEKNAVCVSTTSSSLTSGSAISDFLNSPNYEQVTREEFLANYGEALKTFTNTCMALIGNAQTETL
jgi:hypothetical protein